MYQVWRFPVQPGGFSLFMPTVMEPLHVADKDGEVCLWAKVDFMTPTREWFFNARPTGQPFRGGEYIGTFQLRETAMGTLVFHLFYDH